jgi:hypothetical protein
VLDVFEADIGLDVLLEGFAADAVLAKTNTSKLKIHTSKIERRMVFHLLLNLLFS